MSFISEHNEKYKNFRPLQQCIPFNEDYFHAPSNVKIGQGTILYPNVIIYDNVYIGRDCVIDSGAVIGAEGFSIHEEDGRWVDMKNVGGVLIGDRVKIGANTCIDRASLEGDFTTIEDCVKIDNLVHIAHNCLIQMGAVITPHVTIGGSCVIGRNVWVGIGTNIRQHITVGDDAYICMGVNLIHDVEEKHRIRGVYA